MSIVVLKLFPLPFISLLAALIVKNSDSFFWNYCILLKNRRGPNLKAFGELIWTSIKKSKQELSSNTKFIPILWLISSNLRLKLCWTFHSFQDCLKNWVGKDWEFIRSKKLFPESTMNKMLLRNSSFQVKHHCGKF